MNIWEEVAQKEKLLSGSDIIEAEEGMLFEPDVSGFRRILAVGDLHGNYRRFQSLWSRVDTVLRRTCSCSWETISTAASRWRTA